MSMSVYLGYKPCAIRSTSSSPLIPGIQPKDRAPFPRTNLCPSVIPKCTPRHAPRQRERQAGAKCGIKPKKVIGSQV